MIKKQIEEKERKRNPKEAYRKAAYRKAGEDEGEGNKVEEKHYCK